MYLPVQVGSLQTSATLTVLAMWVLVLIAVDLFWQSACMGGRPAAGPELACNM